MPNRLARLTSLLSFRTISGRLIIGLVALLAIASVTVSVVIDSSLNRSLMSSLNEQLQTATGAWLQCAAQAWHDPGHDADDPGDSSSPNYSLCSQDGQEPGTFEVVLKGSSVPYKSLVSKSCDLSAADTAVLAKLPTTQSVSTTSAVSAGAGPAGPRGPAPAPGSAPTYRRTLNSVGYEYLLTKVAGPAGSGTEVITGLPLTTVDDTIQHVEDTEHVVFAAVLVLVLVLGTGIVELSLRPLRRVAATATRVTELPLDSGEVTLPAGVPDTDPRTEVGRVGAAFNRMLFHVERALGRRAESENRLRRFAADASHELRTPLSAIRGYAELALRHPGPVPEEVTHALGRVQSESARMSVLVDELLLLARLDAGRPLEQEPVDLSRLAIETTSDARVARVDHRWRLELPDEPVLVQGDQHRLHQVLANLLSNAGKHTPPGSTVSVALTLLAGDQIELSVTDDGPGIPPELLPELFERFTRADTSRARDAHEAGRSTGLGLAIVDAVVTAHGGGITVTSQPGRTRFAITLPRPDGQPGEPGGGI